MRRAVLLAASLVVLSCTRKDTPALEAPALVPTAAAASPPAAVAIGADGGPTATEGAPVRFVGRFVKQPDGGMRFAWPGSAMIGRFRGTGVSVRLKDEGWNLFQVVVDGEVKKVLTTSQKKDVYQLAEGLPDAVHTVALHRRTEAKVGDAIFYGFDAQNGTMLPAPAAPERRIEIIGDSISNGYGNEGPNATCGYVNSQQNEYLAYGAIAARALDADHTTIAWSGKTIYEMFEYFPRTLPAQPDSLWDFASAPQPQAVVINVGTNNFMNVDPGEARFVQRYIELVMRVRKEYPKAFIVCALGSMLSNVYPEGRNALTQARKYMKAAVAKMKASGETNLEMLEFPEQNHADGLGCGFHPSLKTHRLMADRLAAFLKERLSW